MPRATSAASSSGRSSSARSSGFFGSGISHDLKNLSSSAILTRNSDGRFRPAVTLDASNAACYSVDRSVIPFLSTLCSACRPTTVPVPAASINLCRIHRSLRDVLDNGLRILTERMTQVRSVSIGVWLTRGSRHETAERGGIAHFVEHMLFKGTGDADRRGHRAGHRLDRRPARRVHRQGVRELLHQGARRAPAARHRHPRRTSSATRRSAPDDIEREKKVVVEEIKMVEDTPDDLVHELFTQGFWEDHPLGRPILGTRETVESFNADLLRELLRERLHAAQPDRVGRGQPRARARPRSGRARSSDRSRPSASRPSRRRRRSCRRC